MNSYGKQFISVSSRSKGVASQLKSSKQSCQDRRLILFSQLSLFKSVSHGELRGIGLATFKLGPSECLLRIKVQFSLNGEEPLIIPSKHCDLIRLDLSMGRGVEASSKGLYERVHNDLGRMACPAVFQSPQ
jgi:hypothetical protein